MRQSFFLHRYVKVYTGFLFCMLIAQAVMAQYQPEYHPLNGGAPLSTGQSGTGSNIDVVYHRAEWSINPNAASKTITGTITTYFRTLIAGVSSISFDLNNNSFNNGALTVLYHGNICTRTFPATGNINIVNISLPSAIAAANTLDSIVINYSGVPPARSGAAEGFQKGSYTDQSGITQTYTTTLSESYEDRDWWPCKADMQDKIDSMDIIVTVPWSGADTFWVATNGKLVDSAFSGANRIFKSKTRYPIASYLVALVVAKYDRYYANVNVNGTTVPVAYYLLRGKTASYYTNAINAMNRINAVVTAFSNKFGDYPFKLEKHGFYDGLLGASGMEHQTFSGMASNALSSVTTLAHELTHQWFGDNVTFSTWNDLWLAEGFARYGEALAAELVPALGINPYSVRNSFKTNALNLGNQSAWIPDGNIASSNLIWNSNYGSTVYERGAAIVSMLRTLCGDTKFFQAMTNYQTARAGKSASTDTLKAYINAVLGADISGFFTSFVGGSGNSPTAAGGVGNPIYNIAWNNPSGNKLLVRVTSQGRSVNSNVSYYNGPVVLHVLGATPATQDTTIVFYDWGGGKLSYAGNGLSDLISGNLLSYDLSFVPTTINYDDSARTLSTGSVTKDANLLGYIWSGGTSTVWGNASNWQPCCGVPPQNVDVTIATTTFPPVLPGPVTIRNLTLNAGKYLDLGNTDLTITGTVSGTGTFSGSASSNLILEGNAGQLNFLQTTAATRSLNNLTLRPGSAARLGSALDVNSINVNTSNFTINTGVVLLVKQ